MSNVKKPQHVLVYIREPFFRDKRKHVDLCGTFVPLAHLADITRVPKVILEKTCDEVKPSIMVPSVPGYSFKSFVDVKHLDVLLLGVGWTEDDARRGKLIFQGAITYKFARQVLEEQKKRAAVSEITPETVSKKASVDIESTKQAPTLQVVPKKKFGSPERAPTISDHARNAEEAAVKACAEMDAQLALLKPRDDTPAWATAILESQRQLRADLEALSKEWKDMLTDRAMTAYMNSPQFAADRKRKIDEELKDVLPVLKQRLEVRALLMGLEERRHAMAEAKSAPALPDWAKEFIGQELKE